MNKKLESLLFLLVAAFFILPIRMSLDNINILNISQIYNNFAVGTGAIFGGLAGLKYLNEFLERKRRQEKENYLKKIYPPNEINSKFNLITSTSNRDWIYLHDLSTNKKHHIASNWTFNALGYNRNMVQSLNDDVFNQIEEGESFLTRGDFGS